jgi:NitT/TauT family transport system permease protein
MSDPMTSTAEAGTETALNTERSVVTAAGPTLPSRARSRTARLGVKVGLPLAVAGLIIGCWYAVSELVLNKYQRFMLPPPHRVLQVGFLTWSNFTALMSALRTTAEVTFLGLAISIVLGVGAALLMSQAKWVENALYPWAVVLQTVPILALTPMLSFFFGFALTSRIIVAVIIAFFPIVSNTLFGLQSADGGMHDLFTLHRASRMTRLWKLQFPAALPMMFAGFRVSAGLAVIGAIVGEFFFKQGQPGLGTNMSVYTSLLEGEQLWANVLTACALGIVVFVFFGWLSRRVVGRWYQPHR